MPEPTASELTVTSTGGARLHTEIFGPEEAPTVVLAHGWTCNTTFWYPVLRHLVPDYRVVLYDQRGHGRTPATPGANGTAALVDDLAAVLDATLRPGRRAVIAGHSMGAMTIVAAADRPEFRDRAVAAVLCSTGTDRLAGEATALPLRPGSLRKRGSRTFLTTKLSYGPVTPVTKAVIRYITMGKGATAEQRTEVARIVVAAPRKARAEWGGVLYELNISESLGRLDIPVTIIHGTADRLTPVVHAHRMAGRLPNLKEFAELPGIGHMTPIEATDKVAETIRGLAKEYL
ncbi:alpha/beta fold hydrolase [Streptomyces sp. NBC_01803]|uniref:alpha/beta fold hydrolase n=1 Tax=Streptomyces sp. NBC_01803 TaxID=2975946 RepID=UPI002DDACAF6|nr:alpha/beta hydrolase [Streptomyces sp. NBC_01803]WSA44628.1 alpha/beta hydrolase [Streptomyces sp. NBC_01803]